MKLTLYLRLACVQKLQKCKTFVHDCSERHNIKIMCLFWEVVNVHCHLLQNCLPSTGLEIS